MTGLADLDVGRTVYEAAVYYDDGENPVAEERPSTYATSERQAEAFARRALDGSRPEHKGGFWYAMIRRGLVVDPIGNDSRWATGSGWPVASERCGVGEPRGAIECARVLVVEPRAGRSVLHEVGESFDREQERSEPD